MSKRATPWKDGKVISIETRKGVFILAQMLKSPFLRFYNTFSEDEEWGRVDVKLFDTLFTKSVVGTFLKHSNIVVVKDALPDLERKESDVWINGFTGSRKVKVWENTSDEMELYILGSEPGGSLVKKDLWWTPTPNQPTRAHPSGVIDSVIIEDIPLNSDHIIDRHELTSLGIFPLTNERLYQCYKAGKNVDPAKDLKFNREISRDYKVAIELMSGGGDKENREKVLDAHFR
jgi:hypothetical protein